MRIISKNRDYYDIGLASSSKEPVYIRKPSEPIEVPPCSIFKEIFKYLPNTNYRYDKKDILWKSTVIGFCGKIYPITKASVDKENYSPRTKICFSAEDIREFIAGDKKLVKRYGLRKLKLKRAAHVFNTYTGYESDQITQIFFDIKAPIFALYTNNNAMWSSNLKYNLISNPFLKAYDFVKVFDPWSAYQEVEMFLGGILGSLGADMVNISDADLAVAKGFDSWSFKKQAPSSAKVAKKHHLKPKK